MLHSNTIIVDYFNKLPQTRQAHCRTVARVCESLSSIYGCDKNLAYKMGLLHDIGYVDNTDFHAITGYRVLVKAGYLELALLALHHSNAHKFVKSHLFSDYPLPLALEPYLKILNTADVCVNSEGNIVTPEERVRDIAERYGENSLHTRVANLQAKNVTPIEMEIIRFLGGIDV